MALVIQRVEVPVCVAVPRVPRVHAQGALVAQRVLGGSVCEQVVARCVQQAAVVGGAAWWGLEEVGANFQPPLRGGCGVG